MSITFSLDFAKVAREFSTVHGGTTQHNAFMIGAILEKAAGNVPGNKHHSFLPVLLRLPAYRYATPLSTAVFTSLAPVPSNLSLVWASLPSSNTVLLWDIRELQLLFTLPLEASSICVPAVVLPYSLVTARDDGHAGLDALASPVRRRRTAAERDSRLLCVLGAAGMNDCEVAYGCVDQREGCDLFGICCGETDTGGAMGPQGCVVSALRLKGNEAGKIGGDGATGR